MIKSGLGVAGLVAATALAFGGAAKADDPPAFAWSMTVGGTSDYIFRGVSQTDEDPAFQASVDATYGLFYAGVWGSNTDEAFTNSSQEIDLYAGIKPTWGPVTFDFGVIYYWYPGDDFDVADYVELKAGATVAPIKNLSLGGFVYWTDEGTFDTGEIFTYEGTAAYTLPAVGIFTPTVSALIGYADADEDTALDPLSYTYWNAGLALAVEKFTFDFRYWGTDSDGETIYGGLADDRFVFTAKVTLP